MSARTDRAITAKTGQVIVNFSPEQLKAPFLLRCGALTIDYIIIIGAPVLGILLSRYMGNDGAKLLNSEIYHIGWLVGLLTGLTNFVIFPMFNGQTVGKALTGLRIVKSDGNSVSLSRILMRQLLGYPLTVLTFGLGFIFSAFNENGRALHDFLAGTIVVFGHRRILNKNLR